MVRHRTKGIQSLCLLCQMGLLTVLFWVVLPLTQNGFSISGIQIPQYLIYNALLLIGLLADAFTMKERDNYLNRNLVACNQAAFRQMLFALAFLFAFVIATKDKYISRAFLTGLIPLAYMTLLVSHRLLPPMLAKLTFGGNRAERILLIGPMKKAGVLRGWLQSKSTIGYYIVGLLCDEPSVTVIHGFKVLGSLDDLESTVRNHGITQVILVEFPMFSNVLSSCTQACEKLGVRMLVVCDFEEKFLHPVTMFEDGGLRFIGLREEPLEDPFNRFCKRTLDVAIAFPVVVLILPFTTLLVWFLHRLESEGPVFLNQPRSGLQNRAFNILKYRTMHVGNQQVAKQATVGDPRIFRSGRWLRKSSIDEFPQFWNVLRGEMSVVGPRPHLVEHNEQFARALNNYHVRANVKPGITGLAQVRGYRGETRTQEDVIRRIKSDIYYLENWSFMLDCWIVFRTFAQVFAPPKSAR